MPRYRRPRRQGVVYGPVTQREHGSDGGFLGRILGVLIVLGAVAVLGVGALNFIGGPGGVSTVASPSPTQLGLASTAPTESPARTPTTSTPSPTPAASPSPEPSPDRTPFAIEPEEGPGSIIFGTGRGANLTIRNPGISFEVGERIFYLAQLLETSPTNSLAIEVHKYDPEADTESLAAEPSINARISRIHTLRQRIDTIELDGPGFYVMRFTRRDEVMAEGWFELTEP